MGKKIAAALLALAFLWVFASWLASALTSDETKIRSLVAEMEEAYDDGSPGACVAPLAHDWRHEGYGVDRQMLLGALFQVARERDRETHELRSKVEVDEDAALVTVDGEHATLTAEAVFSRRRGAEWQATWRIRIEAELVDGDDGWEIVRSRHEDLEGTVVGR